MNCNTYNYKMVINFWKWTTPFWNGSSGKDPSGCMKPATIIAFFTKFTIKVRKFAFSLAFELFLVDLEFSVAWLLTSTNWGVDSVQLLSTFWSSAVDVFGLVSHELNRREFINVSAIFLLLPCYGAPFVRQKFKQETHFWKDFFYMRQTSHRCL